VELVDYLPAAPAPDADGTALERIAELTPEHRAVVVLRYVLEYTPGEIAELLDLPRGTVNSRLRRGLDRMKAGDDES
jgi:RNA polymerase sigma-70 factor (ECF subfamily)